MNSGKKIAGVIGWPVSHSLSPKLHGYWLREYKIEGEYNAYPVEPQALADFLHHLAGSGLRGCNITLPHKETALEILREGGMDTVIDPLAQEVGAINTIVVKDGKLHGSNTDIYGFSENIRPYIRGRHKAVVLGAGGAANAVWAALRKEGFTTIIVTNRSEEKFSKLTGDWYTIKKWEDRSAILEDADLLVNTTSLGMSGKDALDIDLSLLPKTALVTDIVYTPLITPLLAQATARGNPVVDGLGMLLHQAVPGFAAWFGVTPEVTPELRQYMLSAS